MTERNDASDDRVSVVVDRATRIVRLLTWTAMFALVCLMLWVVSGMAARAEDPEAAARAIGNAGNSAARTIARDSSNAAEVPGYAGTNLPERNIGANALENRGRARLADPDDPGGAAGRAVVEGTTSRPAASVPAGDPLVRRSENIAASPQSSAHGAEGLASGSATECGADLQDAGDGGACGSVRWCVGADCETVSSQSNTGFVNATTRLNMALELGGEEFDRDRVRFFTGQRRACHIKLFGLANCCRNSGLLVGLGTCPASERELAEERNAGNTHYLGRYCSKRTFFGACIRRSRAWCVFGSKLGRILQQQSRAQFGIGWSNCRGLTVAEVESIDFASFDLSEFTQDLMDGSREPAVSLPDAGDTGDAMRQRIRNFYRRGRRWPALHNLLSGAPWRACLPRRPCGPSWARPRRAGNGAPGAPTRVRAPLSGGTSTATGGTTRRGRSRFRRPLPAPRNPRRSASRRCARRWRRPAPRRSSIRRPPT